MFGRPLSLGAKQISAEIRWAMCYHFGRTVHNIVTLRLINVTPGPLPRLTRWSMTPTDVRPTSEPRCQANLGRDSLGHVLLLRPNCKQHSNSLANQCNSCRPLPWLTRWSMTPIDVRPTSEPRHQANLGRDSLGRALWLY